MTPQQASEILGDWVDSHGGICGRGEYALWARGESEICLDGRFTADQLEAMAVAMRATAQAHTD